MAPGRHFITMQFGSEKCYAQFQKSCHTAQHGGTSMKETQSGAHNTLESGLYMDFLKIPEHCEPNMGEPLNTEHLCG